MRVPRVGDLVLVTVPHVRGPRVGALLLVLAESGDYLVCGDERSQTLWRVRASAVRLASETVVDSSDATISGLVVHTPVNG